MNNLPAVIPKTPEWFLGEIEDLLELLQQSDTKKKNNILGLKEIKYITHIPERLFQCGFINSGQKNEFTEKIYYFTKKCKNTYGFLLMLIGYMYESGFLKHNMQAFKNVRDILVQAVKSVTKNQELTQKKIAQILAVDNKYFPEVLPGEVIDKDGVIIDSIYSGLENIIDAILPLLYSSSTNFNQHIPLVYNFYSELLCVGYIDKHVYQELSLSKSRSVGTSISIGLLHAISGGFFDNDIELKTKIIPLIREYILESREYEIYSYHSKIFQNAR